MVLDSDRLQWDAAHSSQDQYRYKFPLLRGETCHPGFWGAMFAKHFVNTENVD